MTMYKFLSNKLQKFSVCDFRMVKGVYVILGLFIASLYVPVLGLSAWFYLIFACLAAAPLLMFAFSFEGDIRNKAEQYLKHNNPSNQVLTLVSCVNFGFMLAVIFPFLASWYWWVYLVLIVLLLIKPFYHVFLNKKI